MYRCLLFVQPMETDTQLKPHSSRSRSGRSITPSLLPEVEVFIHLLLLLKLLDASELEKVNAAHCLCTLQRAPLICDCCRQSPVVTSLCTNSLYTIVGHWTQSAPSAIFTTQGFTNYRKSSHLSEGDTHRFVYISFDYFVHTVHVYMYLL